MLIELREFKSKNEELYRKLQKKKKDKELEEKLNQKFSSTISFVKMRERIKVKIHEKTFLEAAKIFSANLDEKEYYDKHHDQLKLAMKI